MSPDITQYVDSHRADCRDRRDRLQLSLSHWEDQMDKLVEAYLVFMSQARKVDEPFGDTVINEEGSGEKFEMMTLDVFCMYSLY